MRSTSVVTLKAKLSQFLRYVANGDTVLVLHRGRPIARIVPPRDDDASWADRLAMLERDGVLRRAVNSPDASLLDQPAPRIDATESLLDAVLDERDRGR